MFRLSQLYLFLAIFCSSAVFAQSHKTGTWGIATIVLPSNTTHRWGGYFESQVRTDEMYFKKYFYHELKTGISYALDNNYVGLIGTGRYITHPGNGLLTTETRLWEQMTFTQFLSRIKFEHRYRVEQRWVNSIYRNRFRYRLNAIVPVNKQKIQAKTLFVSVFDEIFLNNKQPNFERNRISASLGYQFTPAISVQGGWINQYNNGLVSTNDKNNLILNFIYQIQRKKPSSHEELPTLKD